MERGKLTDDQVREIRRSGSSARSLAREYGVTHQTILNVRGGRTYAHVLDEVDGPVSGPQDKYFRKDALGFLKGLPDGYCQTIVTCPFFSADYRRKLDVGSYISWQRAVIEECIRVAGAEGLVLYQDRMLSEVAHQRGEVNYELVAGMPLKQMIVVNHRGVVYPDKRSGNKRPRRDLIPRHHTEIFMFSGTKWSIPDEVAESVSSWGDVWEMDPSWRWSHDGAPLDQWVSFPEELADRCIALGKGIVLDPFAAAGEIPLAAIRAGRNWLACDVRPHLIETFKMRSPRHLAGEGTEPETDGRRFSDSPYA